jgi:large subunit ribosomal protein L7/L12
MSASPAPSEDPPAKIQALCDELCALNVIEMNQLVTLFKDKVGLAGVDVMPPMMGGMMPMAAGAAPPASSAPEAAAEEESAPAKEYFDLKLLGFDAASKIKVIKEVRALSGLGLKEAKELVEGVPKVVKKEVSKADGEEMLEKLKAVGAEVALE